MAYVSDGWLKGDALRDRGHRPIEVHIEQHPLEAWDRENHVDASFTIERDGGDYKCLLLTRRDLLWIAPRLMAALGDTDLLNCLEAALVRRKRSPEELASEEREAQFDVIRRVLTPSPKNE